MLHTSYEKNLQPWVYSGELTCDESSEKNDEGSDDPEYDPKFLH